MKSNSDRAKYCAAIAALATFILYVPALWNRFVYWDDNVYIYENPHLRPSSPEFLRWAFFDSYAGNWHPLTWMSHAADYVLWGLTPLGHHLTNNVLHSINVFLVVVLAVRVLQFVKEKAAESTAQGLLSNRAIIIAAATTGLLFGIHPLHVESAAWVSERKDLLCALFYLGAVLMYLKYATEQSVNTGASAAFKEKKLLAAFGLFILALLSKPMAVSLPVILLILDWFPLRKIRSAKTFWTAAAEKAPFVGLSLVSSIVTVYVQQAGGAVSSMEQIPLTVRAPVAVKAVAAYLGKMVVPINLVPFYPYPLNVSLWSQDYLGPAVLTIAIMAGCIALAGKQKFWLVAWSCYLVTLIPVIGIVQAGGQAMADRYTYLPSIGPFLLIGVGTAWLWEKADKSGERSILKRAVLATSGIVLIGVLSFLTISQTRVWRDSVTLWTHEIETVAEPVPLAYANRGVAFQRIGLLDKAAVDYEKAIELDPAAFRPYISLSTVFEAMGQIERARQTIERAIALNPSSHEAYRNRGILEEKSGMLEAAIEDFTRAIAIEPMYFEAYNSRGIVFGKLQQFEKAIADYDAAIRINPFSFGARTNRAIAYTLMGRYDDALPDFDAAIALNGKDGSGYFNRASFYRRTGNVQLAQTDFHEACTLGIVKACGMANEPGQRSLKNSTQ